MLYYCESCHMLSEQDCCKSCGKKNLRNPNRTDFCFLTEVNSMFGEMFKRILEEEKIPYSDIPSGSGVRSYFGQKLENLKIFITYEFFYIAKELLNEILVDIEQEQSSELKKNIGMLFASLRNEKKLKKILNLSENDSLVAYCTDEIMNADRVVNKGKISSCTKGGYYLFVYRGDEFIVINSVTYEIISAKRISKRKRGQFVK